MPSRKARSLFVVLTLLIANAAAAQDKKPNILVIFGDDIGQSNISAYTMGLMGYHTPNIDRIAKDGMIFTDYYAEQLHRRALVVHHRPVHVPHRALEGRHPGRARRPPAA